MFPWLKTLLRMVVMGLALAPWCTPAAAEEQPLWVESFAGKLADGWTWIDELPGTWQVGEDALELQVAPVGLGLWKTGQKHPNLLLRDPGTKGDFAVEVQLASTPKSRFEHAGLLLYADGDNYVCLNQELISKQELVMVSEKDAQPVVKETPYEHEEVCLRLAVRGAKVTGQYRHYDSDAWQTLGELALPVAGPYRVGVFAGRLPKDGDPRATFRKFRILPLSAAETVKETTAAKPEPSPPATAPTAPAKRAIRDDVSLAVQAREAAERALPYIEKDGTKWMKDRKCLSCHYVSFMVWSFRDAKARGLAVDSGKLKEWTDWSLGKAVGQGSEGPAQMLLARDRTDTSEATTQLIHALRDAILKSQESDGFWKPGGQLPGQKRPLAETTQVSAMWNVLALDSLDPPHDQASEARDKALAWLRKTPPTGNEPAKSSEWYAVRLLVEQKLGEPAQVAALRDKILAAQQADGGWGWLLADKSDALGTGVSLYALGHAGVASTDPAIERAWKFLIETQTEGGSWVVNGTKTATKDKPHPFSGFWGSTWAVLGLSHTLPKSSGETVVGSVSTPGTGPP